MPLRTIDFNATKRFTDGDDWIELRTGGLTKHESDVIRDLTANYRIDPASLDNPGAAMVEVNNRVADANRVLFDVLCVAWSQDGPPNAAAYDELDEESGRWVDDCISEILAERRKRAEGKSRSSARPPKPATSSPKAASSTSRRTRPKSTS
jgi:hypothetical protein